MYEQSQPPQGMRSAPPLASAAQRVSTAGRGDDSTLIHISPDELRGLASLAPGGRLPVNPKTGLPEAGILSAVLGVVGGIGGSFVGMPWLGAGLGSFGGSLLEGKSLGSSLGMGVLGGIGAYGMGQAADMLGAVGAGAGASSAAQQMAANGVQAATMAPAAEAAASPYAFADLAGAGGGMGGASAGANAGMASALEGTSQGLMSPMGQTAQQAVSQFGGAPTTVDPQGAAQNFSPWEAMKAKAGNIAQGATDPSALWNTFGTNASKTTLPIIASLYGQGTNALSPKTYSPPQQQHPGYYPPTLPGPNQRKYIPAPKDWDYSTGKEWNYWTPAFADGGGVDKAVTRQRAPNQFIGFAHTPLRPGPPDSALMARENDLIRKISRRGVPDEPQPPGADDFADGGRVYDPIDQGEAASLYPTGAYADDGFVGDSLDQLDQTSRDDYSFRNVGRGRLTDQLSRNDSVISRQAAAARNDRRMQDMREDMTPEEQLDEQNLAARHQAMFNTFNRNHIPPAGGVPGYAMGGGIRALRGRAISGPGGGLDDAIPAVINGRKPAKLSSGEYVVPAHAVSALGDGSTQAGVGQLDQMVNSVMNQKYGTRQPQSMRGVR